MHSGRLITLAFAALILTVFSTIGGAYWVAGQRFLIPFGDHLLLFIGGCTCWLLFVGLRRFDTFDKKVTQQMWTRKRLADTSLQQLGIDYAQLDSHM